MLKEKQDKNQAKSFSEDLGNGISLDMVYIPGGKFIMGSPGGRGFGNEMPQHEVIVQPFYMGKYPITQEQYQQVLDKNPSHFEGSKRPVECVSWNDAIRFCRALSEIVGRRYFLPSEAEWEYACRAGTNTAFYFGETITDRQVNFNWNVGETTSVGQYPHNDFGLYDMHGNVYEWCQDDWHEDYTDAPNDGSAWVLGSSDTKLIRGGSWDNPPDICRSAYRNICECNDCDSRFGFRVVCVASRTT